MQIFRKKLDQAHSCAKADTLEKEKTKSDLIDKFRTVVARLPEAAKKLSHHEW